MELNELIEGLGSPAAYPFPVDGIEVRQTHISVVFLAGPVVYKVKKPVHLGFLDFSTLDQRRHFCEEEVRLNRRLAPEVYLGVVPIARTPAGVRFEHGGEVIEWAVKMERLPEDSSLLARLERGDVGRDLIERLARKIAAFHMRAESRSDIAKCGRSEVVARNARENFEQSSEQIGSTVSRTVFTRLKALTEEMLERFRTLMDERAERGLTKDTHGDLHLDHVYYLPDREPPNDLIAIDCIEFSERFRYADPISDVAFLVMDLIFHGHRDLADELTGEYLRATGDSEGQILLPFYVAYRAIVRAKVEGIEVGEREIAECERQAACARARAHWLLALGEMEPPAKRPCLVMVAGLPGSGKSTLARGLAGPGNFRVIRTDVVRKELAGLEANTSARGQFDEGIYTAEWTERTYAECLDRAKRFLFEGERVIVDASFAREAHRGAFLAAARRMGVPAVLLLCRVNPETARQRIASRRGDASDADEQTYERAAERWQTMGTESNQWLREISTDGTEQEALERACEILAIERLND